MEVFLAVLLLAFGFLLLVKGADYFVEGAAGIATRFGIPELVIGLTIVAMGTSAPEAAVSITAAKAGSAGITIGNVVGSNIMNVLLILGITSIIATLAVQKTTVYYEIPFMIVATIVLGICGLTGNKIVFYEGIILWALFVGYLVYLFVMAKKGQDSTEKIASHPLWLQLIMLFGGIVGIIWGSDLTVDNATVIASALGMDDRLIGLTIVAFGTSLPELVTCIAAAKKGSVDIAIGNIVGSNIFNILFVVGTTALITPVVYKTSFLLDTIIAIAVAGLLWLAVFRKKELRRNAGVVMLICYFCYFAYLIFAGKAV